MGNSIFTPEHSDYQHVLTVYTAPGRVTVGTDTYPKARLWVLEDHRVVIVVPGEDRGVRRIEAGDAPTLRRVGPHTVVADIEGGELTIVEASCSCGMGAAGSAGPVEGLWKLDRVRSPNWFQQENP